jgi:glucose-1-phosphate cytidylyltransferase
VLEFDLPGSLTRDRRLAAFRHEGFWQCLDMLRDKQALERPWLTGAPPW